MCVCVCVRTCACACECMCFLFENEHPCRDQNSVSVQAGCHVSVTHIGFFFLFLRKGLSLAWSSPGMFVRRPSEPQGSMFTNLPQQWGYKHVPWATTSRLLFYIGSLLMESSLLLPKQALYTLKSLPGQSFTLVFILMLLLLLLLLFSLVCWVYCCFVFLFEEDSIMGLCHRQKQVI